MVAQIGGKVEGSLLKDWWGSDRVATFVRVKELFVFYVFMYSGHRYFATQGLLVAIWPSLGIKIERERSFCFLTRASSSVGKSTVLITLGSWVRIPAGLFKKTTHKEWLF